MPSCFAVVDGARYRCDAYFIRNAQLAVIGIDVYAEEDLRGRVGILPPYHVDNADRFSTLPEAELLEEVLGLFVAHRLAVTVSFVLDRYRLFLRGGSGPYTFTLETVYVDPRPVT
jgi:hypothetical protein